MIDMVEAQVIAGQMAERLAGRRIVDAALAEARPGSMRDAYLLSVPPAEFRARLEGVTVVAAYAKHRHVMLETDGGTGLDVWDVYGRILLIAPGAKIPGHPPVALGLDDGATWIVLPGVWGALRLAPNDELRAFRDSSSPDVLEATSAAFTPAALSELLHRDEFRGEIIKQALSKIGAPGIMSVMGAYNQEVLYRARIHPKRQAQGLAPDEIAALHGAIRDVVPAVSQETEGRPCPVCGTAIARAKMGGAGKYYICPGCQVPGGR